jgi:hypothetical protein
MARGRDKAAQYHRPRNRESGWKYKLERTRKPIRNVTVNINKTIGDGISIVKS